MRRVRVVREKRDAVVLSVRERRRKERQKKAAALRRNVVVAKRPKAQKAKNDGISSSKIEQINFIPFDKYIYTSKQIKVCHIIESFGIGGGQTMMMEMIRAFDKYYHQNIITMPIYLASSPSQNSSFYGSYGVHPIHVRPKELKNFLQTHEIDVVVQHRLMHSSCLKDQIPKNVKYLIINHTFHRLDKVKEFKQCDLYVSVCDFLNRKSYWDDNVVHPSRRYVILNGVENDYIEDIPTKSLEGSFRTGRCHRLVSSKFNVDSLRWMSRDVAKYIPSHHHYLIGSSKEAKVVCRKTNCCHYVGTVTDRKEKISIIKSLHMYFYETFHSEGASIAILESLACGVPVVCKPFGGNTEIIRNGVNGYVVRDRAGFLQRMREYSGNIDLQNRMKKMVKDDFESRLHIKHTISKYAQLFEHMIKN